MLCVQYKKSLSSLQIARKAENSVGEMVYYEHFYVQVSQSYFL